MASQKECWLSEPYLGEHSSGPGLPQAAPSGDTQAVSQGVTYSCMGAWPGSSQAAGGRRATAPAKTGRKVQASSLSLPSVCPSAEDDDTATFHVTKMYHCLPLSFQILLFKMGQP